MKLLADLPRNARYCIIFEPMWAVFNGMIFFYTPLYMKNLGISEIEMGIVNTAALFSAFFFFFIAAPITNKLGRKKTTLIFDLIAWGPPMLLWAFARSFWYFLAAGVVNTAVRVVFVSWNCLISEDTEADKRSKVYGIINVIGVISGIFTPVTGLFIAKYGTVATMRVLFVIGFASYVSMFFLRNALVTETRAGRVLIDKHSGFSLIQGLKSYVATLSYVFKNRYNILLSLIYIITNFISSLNFFQVIYLKEQLKFSEIFISLAPAVNTVVYILLYVLVIPVLGRFRECKVLGVSFSICTLGALLFLFIPEKGFLVFLVAICILSVGNMLSLTYRDTAFMNNLGEHEKADAFSGIQTLTTFICIPSGYLAGYIYEINPKYPFIAIFTLFICAVVISMLMFNKGNALQNTSAAHTDSQKQMEGNVSIKA